MHGEDLLIDDRGDGQAVETISKCLPQLDVVSSFAFIVEAIDTIDRGTFVITSEEIVILTVNIATNLGE